MPLDTTRKTENVTVILDCCHSGRMVRRPPHGKKAIRKSLRATSGTYDSISRHMDRLRQEGMLREEDIQLENNSHAVFIAAAAVWESVYENEFGENVGALTEASVQVIENTDGNDPLLSWRTMMLRVQELVNVSFPQQHPRVEGPQMRLMFSLDHQVSGGLLI